MTILGTNWFWLELAAGIGLTVWGIRLSIVGIEREHWEDNDTILYGVSFGLATSITVIFFCASTIIAKAFEVASVVIVSCAGFLVFSVICLLLASREIEKKIKAKAESSLKQPV